MILYHGSNLVVEKPMILTSGFYKDFGYGFYCTKIEKQAKKWALIKRKKHVVNEYIFIEDKELKICSFPEMTEEWLDFIVACRRGMEHLYDVVEGPMADDQIWDYVEDFMRGEISRTAFWELVKFRYPIHQIVFCTEKALKSLQYKGSYKL